MRPRGDARECHGAWTTNPGSIDACSMAMGNPACQTLRISILKRESGRAPAGPRFVCASRAPRAAGTRKKVTTRRGEHTPAARAGRAPRAGSLYSVAHARMWNEHARPHDAPAPPRRGPAGWNSQRHTSHMVHSRLPDKGYRTLTHSLRLKITSNALYYAKAKETRARTRDAAASRRTDDRRDRRAQQSANASGRFEC